jgi:UDP-N-acetylglucosamine--N-acetylmuramyl-(pentapeptide) pyrophosphoryl-undecaprenol N-acetylglucosamine transferase
MRILIAGGGTGGHVFPALAIGEALRDQMEDVEVLFVGSRGKMEMEKIPANGFKIIGLPIAGFHRRFTWKNLLFPFKLLYSLLLSFWVLWRFKPDCAVGVGGYASGPILKVAGWMGIPYILQEQNSFPGVTNRMLAAKAAAICVAWPGMDKYFPKEKIKLTGNPLRKGLTGSKLNAGQAKEHLKLDQSKKIILVLGGSLGAASINTAIQHNESWIKANNQIQLIWQCGKQYAADAEKLSVAQLKQVKLMPFIERMDMAYAAADIIVARAGAMSISELCLVGKPLILVPSPNVAADHQNKNARSLQDLGAAVLIPDNEVRARLFIEIDHLLKSPEIAHKIGEALAHQAKPDAASEIVRILQNIKSSRP